MNNTISDIELIWKHIDGDCSPEEAQLVSERMLESDFYSLYVEQRDLHETMSIELRHEAPSDLADSVMAQISKKPSTEAEHPRSSFSYFLAMVGALLILIILLRGQYSESWQYADEWDHGLSLVTEYVQYFLVLPIIWYIDRYLLSRWMSA